MKGRNTKPFYHYIILLLLTMGSYLLASPISINLTTRQTCDLELLLNGGFAPLKGFMGQDDYNNVVKNIRLADGNVWPIPIVLDVSQEKAKEINYDDEILLKDSANNVLAKLKVTDIWQPDKLQEALKVYGTQDIAHSGVNYLFNKVKDVYIGGPVTLVNMPKYYDFTELRKTPKELKKYFKENNIDKVVAFQTRNPLHRAHFELTTRAIKQIDGHLLLHPSVCQTKPGDVDHFTRVKCYKHLLKYYEPDSVTLSLLPLAMRMAGPREALWHAIIRKNYGATHFIIGRDHAGPGNDSNGKPFYGIYDAQELVKKYADEIGIKILTFEEMAYLENQKIYVPKNEAPPGENILNISGTQFRKMLRDGAPVPEWFSFPEVIEELQKSFPPKHKQGITLFFTGLSGSGKSTIANALAIKLSEIQNRPITILDGDKIRKLISSGLGFSKEDRSLNIQRISFIANEISKNGGIAICPVIAPYAEDRQNARDLISKNGNFIEIYISTPLEICQDRDPKGLYALVQAGKIEHFTGIDDPYEPPTKVELNINASRITVEDALNQVLSYLKDEGLI